MATLGNEVILFGGADSSQLGDTWVFDGTRWTQLSVSGAPPAGSGGAMATLGSEVVLYGGGGPDNTWTFDGTGWSLLGTPRIFGSHARQRDHSLRRGRHERYLGVRRNELVATSRHESSARREDNSLATLGGEVVLFGGSGAVGGNLNDTWTFDGARWTQVAVVSAPSARQDVAMATLGGRVVLFGGSGDGTLDDTWTFDGTTWSQVTVSGPPPARFGAAMAFLP
jgi:hypothetical protein